MPHPTRVNPQVHKHPMDIEVSFFKNLGRVHRFVTGEDIGNAEAQRRAEHQMPFFREHVLKYRPLVTPSTVDKHLKDLIATVRKTMEGYKPTADRSVYSLERQAHIRVAESIARRYPQKILFEGECLLLLEMVRGFKAKATPRPVPGEAWIQIIASPETTNRCKIGFTTANPDWRLKGGYQNGALVPTVWVYRYRFSDLAGARQVDDHIKQVLIGARLPDAATESYIIAPEAGRTIVVGACDLFNVKREEQANPEWFK